MKFFFDCPSSCVFPGYYSWEGFCPSFNLAFLLFYVFVFISLALLIYNKIKKDSQKTSNQKPKPIEHIKTKKIPVEIPFKTKSGKTVMVKATKIVKDS